MRPFKNAPFCPIFRRRRRLWRDKRRQAQILILEILRGVFLWLEFSPSLILNKIEHFSNVRIYSHYSTKIPRKEHSIAVIQILVSLPISSSLVPL
jgi:hypothetical protein